MRCIFEVRLVGEIVVEGEDGRGGGFCCILDRERVCFRKY